MDNEQLIKESTQIVLIIFKTDDSGPINPFTSNKYVHPGTVQKFTHFLYYWRPQWHGFE